ncbi:L2 protein [Papillomaviridae sp. Haddock_c45]|nr:L2 protein [Papillomaviridae sp. Haddock_c45]
MHDLLLFLEYTSMDSLPPTIHKRTKRANVNEFPYIEPWPDKVARWLAGFLYIGGGPSASESIAAAISESIVAPHFIPDPFPVSVEAIPMRPIVPTVKPVEPISIPLEPLKPYIPNPTFKPPIRHNPFDLDLPDLPTLEFEPSNDTTFGVTVADVNPWKGTDNPAFEMHPKEVHIYDNAIVNEPEIFEVEAEVPIEDIEDVINPFAAEDYVPPKTSTPKGRIPKPRGKPLQNRGERFELVHMHAFENPLDVEEDIGLFDMITDIDGVPITPGEGRNYDPDEYFESTSGIISRVWKGWREGMSTRRGAIPINTRVIMEIDPIIEIEMEPIAPMVDERVNMTIFSDSEAVAQSGRRADTARMVEQRQAFRDNYEEMGWNKPLVYKKGLFDYGISKAEGAWMKSGPFKFSSEEGFQLDILGEDYRPAFTTLAGYGFMSPQRTTEQYTQLSWTPLEPPLSPTPVPSPYTPLVPSFMYAGNDYTFDWSEYIAHKKCKKKKNSPYSCVSDASRKAQ